MKDLIRKILWENVAIYSVEELRDLASKYTNFLEFKKNEPKALAAIRRRGKDFENELTSHMDKSHYKKWSDDELRAEASKYQTKSDFQKLSPNAEASARSRGKDFFDDITSHMTIKKRDVWSDDELRDEALKYNSKVDFQNGSPSAYQKAVKNKELFDKITNHMIDKLVYWNSDMVKNEALKYKTKSEFRDKNPNAYAAALRIKKKSPETWLDLTSHMVDLHQKWTDERLRAEVEKYETLADFWRFSNSAAQIAKDKGQHFYDDLTKNLKKTIQWTDEMLKDEALKFKNLPEFRKKSPNAVQAAISRGILKDITMHMEKVGSRYERLIYAYEFSDKSVYVGLTYNLDKRDRSHMKEGSSSVYQHMISTGLKPIRKSLTKYLTKEEASEMEGKLLQKYFDDGWKILNKAKTGSLGGNTRKWTMDKIKDEAKKYDNLSDFYLQSPSALNAAKDIFGKDFYKEITSHMKSKIRYLTDDELYDISKKFTTKKDFFDNDRKAYNIAVRRGREDKELWKKLTSHMVPMRNRWSIDDIKKEALKFTTKKEFHNNSPSAYNAAKNKGKDFFNDVTSHMLDKRKKINRY